MGDPELFEFISGRDFDPSRCRVRSYSIHGLSVNILSNSSFIQEALSEFLRYFLCPGIVTRPEVQFYLAESPLNRIDLLGTAKREGNLLYDSLVDDAMNLSGEMGIRIQYRAWRGYYVADFGEKGAMVLNLPEGKGIGFFPDPSSLHPSVFSNFLFLTGFSEILRSKGYFLIHGAALAMKGKGILIPGFTGSGKTTLSLSLARGGFKFLSDDRPILVERKGGFELLAFPEGIDVTDQTISFFPEISGLPSHAFTAGTWKKRFWIEEPYPNAILDSCAPGILIFPQVVDKGESRLEPIPRIEAIERFLPHTLLVFEEQVARRQFHLLCRLIEGMDCYLLRFGRDVLEVHRLVGALLG